MAPVAAADSWRWPSSRAHRLPASHLGEQSLQRNHRGRVAVEQCRVCRGPGRVPRAPGGVAAQEAGQCVGGCRVGPEELAPQGDPIVQGGKADGEDSARARMSRVASSTPSERRLTIRVGSQGRSTGARSWPNAFDTASTTTSARRGTGLSARAVNRNPRQRNYARGRRLRATPAGPPPAPSGNGWTPRVPSSGDGCAAAWFGRSSPACGRSPRP